MLIFRSVCVALLRAAADIHRTPCTVPARRSMQHAACDSVAGAVPHVARFAQHHWILDRVPRRHGVQERAAGFRYLQYYTVLAGYFLQHYGCCSTSKLAAVVPQPHGTVTAAQLCCGVELHMRCRVRFVSVGSRWVVDRSLPHCGAGSRSSRTKRSSARSLRTSRCYHRSYPSKSPYGTASLVVASESAADARAVQVRVRTCGYIGKREYLELQVGLERQADQQSCDRLSDWSANCRCSCSSVRRRLCSR